MKKGKILSMMLVFLMMISFLPTNIYAADDTKTIGQLVVTSYDQLTTGLGDAADVSKDADGHINIKLNKNLKGQLKLNIKNAYYVFDANGKTLDGDCEGSTSGYVPESLCLEHSSKSTMVLKGNGTYKRGTYYAIFCGSGCKYIILSARLEGSVGSNGDVDVRTQLQDGYEYYTATKNGNNLFDAQNTKENQIQVDINDYSKDVYVFEQHGTHQHVYDQEVESSKYVKQAATCVTPGIYYKSCTCGAKSDSELDTFTTGHLGHDYTVQIKKEAYLKSKAKDCTEHDVYWYICSRCGKASTTISYADLDSKVEHVSSDWIVDKEATTESEGSKHKECTVCKEVLETEKIAKLNNKETVAPTAKKEAKAEIKTEVTSTKAVKTGDSTNIIEVVCLLVFSLVVLTLVRKYC